MDISVILLTYNQEDAIERAILSVLNQEFDGDYEIIIGDDCSSDNTPAICKKYADLYPHKIKYIRREKNIGLLENYYDCLRQARGTFIADCAGDDYWVNTRRLQLLFNVISSRPDVNLVSGQWNCFDESTNQLTIAPNAAKPGEYSGRKYILDIVVNKMVVNLSSSLYRKSLIIKMMEHHPEIMIGKHFKFEDLQIVLACISKGPIVVIPDTVYMYCIGRDSVSNPDSFLKRYRYSSKSIRQQRILQEYFLTNPDEEGKNILTDFYKQKGDYIMAMAFKSGPDIIKVDSIDDEFINNCGIKGKIYYNLMRFKSVWKLFFKLQHHLMVSKSDK